VGLWKEKLGITVLLDGPAQGIRLRHCPERPLAPSPYQVVALLDRRSKRMAGRESYPSPGRDQRMLAGSDPVPEKLSRPVLDAEYFMVKLEKGPFKQEMDVPCYEKGTYECASGKDDFQKECFPTENPARLCHRIPKNEKRDYRRGKIMRSKSAACICLTVDSCSTLYRADLWIERDRSAILRM